MQYKLVVFLVCAAAAAECTVITQWTNCTAEHKNRFYCSGKRNRTEFVKRGAMSDDTLRSGKIEMCAICCCWMKQGIRHDAHFLIHRNVDFKFLEEVSLADDVAKRCKPPTPRRVLPSHLKSLVHQARLRGVNLKLVSPGMQKRKLNSSRYDYRSKSLLWRVVWKISGLTGTENKVSEQANEGLLIECIDARVDDESIVSSILEPHINQYYRQNDNNQGVNASDTAMARVAVVLRKEGTPANKPEYYRIHMTSSLKDALAGKTIIEYPEFLCIPLDNLDQYIT